MTEADFSSYLAGWRRRWEQDRREDTEAARRARVVAGRLAEILRDRFGAHRVVLVGSLARGDFRRGSDIDLAAEGVPARSFVHAGAVLEQSAEGLRVDLVPIEDADPLFLDALEREGVPL